MRLALIFTLSFLAMGACDGGGDPVQQALRETATANQSAAVRETATMAPPALTDQAWIDRMTMQNREAIALADAALAESRDPEVRRMVQAAKDARLREIAEMQAWKPAAAPAE